MTTVDDILKQRPGLGRPQRQVLATLFVTMLVRRGRVNCRHVSRDCDDSERTIARPFREPFAWPDVQQRVRMTALDPRAELVAAHDASFIPKRGQQRFGLGLCCNGCASRAERGLESSTRAVVDVTRRCACPLAVAPTPPGGAAPTTAPKAPRVDFDTPQRREPRQRVPPGVTSHGVDGYYAKTTSLDAVVSRDRPAITTRRSDADGLLLSTGPHPKRRGARRQDDGKVPCQALSRCEDLGTRAEAPPRHLYPAVVWHKTLQRRLRLVVLRQRPDPATRRCIVLGSTAPELEGHTLGDLDAARFQSEFLLRDSQQCTGRRDCQARAESG